MIENNPTLTSPAQDNSSASWLTEVSFNADGLVAAIAQDHQTGEILMMAWMNAEALQLTAQTQTAVYYSRSRGKLWHKGETSGHTQIVHEILLDCDGDALILKVTQLGDIACHTGRRSCFYRQLLPAKVAEQSASGDTVEAGTTASTAQSISEQPETTTQGAYQWQTITPVLKDPKQIYADDASNSAADNAPSTMISTMRSATDINDTINAKTTATVPPINLTDNPHDDASSDANGDGRQILAALDSILQQRKQADPDGSYVASLYAKGLDKILEKVGEEAIETILAAKNLQASASNCTSNMMATTPAEPTTAIADDTAHLIYEIADVWFHTMVTMAWFNIESQHILLELSRRFGLSGLAEKASRQD